MNAPRHRRALDIFEASLGLAEAERSAFLRRPPARDPALAAELGASQRAQEGASAVLRPTRARRTRQTRPPPERIGVFRLGRLLGRGGMGTVYEAERGDGLFEQRVAIKLLSSQRWADELEHRFHSRAAHPGEARASQHRASLRRRRDGRRPVVPRDGVHRRVADHGASRRSPRPRPAGAGAAVRPAVRRAAVRAPAVGGSRGHQAIQRPGQPGWLGQAARFRHRAVAGPAGRSGVRAASPRARRPRTEAYAPPERSAGGPATVAGDVFSLGVVLRELLGAAATRGELPADLRAIVATATAPGACVEVRQRRGTLGGSLRLAGPPARARPSRRRCDTAPACSRRAIASPSQSAS